MTQKPRNADYTKEYNRKAVLRILRRQAMSRAELARATGLTRAAASLIAEELLNAGVVTELAPQSAGRGRSATPLALRPDSYYASRWIWREKAAPWDCATSAAICCNAGSFRSRATW